MSVAIDSAEVINFMMLLQRGVVEFLIYAPGWAKE
ncbi:hypothetical protein SAMN05444161_3131 [Rhizobiales bacterium GAS191]|nr:hypothetical protein SAMN05444161_3131 [Rhizobiales bacterium GAS191]